MPSDDSSRDDDAGVPVGAVAGDGSRDAATVLTLLRSATQGMRLAELRAATDLTECRLGAVLLVLQRCGDARHEDGLWAASSRPRG